MTLPPPGPRPLDTPIRVLHLEDNALDAELIQRTLIAQCPQCELVRARGRTDYEAAIDRERFDVILCDYNLPDYSGLEALNIARERQPDAPVVVVTGTLSEDEAVECIKAGATDYILKSRLQRLGPAVTRALREAAEQRERRQAEAALRISEERLQLALEASEVCVWEYDILSGYVSFSRQLGPMLGYAADEVPARIDAWETLTHPEDIKTLRTALARHYRGETPGIDIEYRIRAKDGQWRWLHTLGRVVQRDSSGRAIHVSGTHRDITQRRRADEMLRLQELAIDAATNAIVIVDARAADYPIVHVNGAFQRITGYSPAESIGRNCRFLQGRDRDQPDLERLREAVALGSEASVVLRNYRKDGTPFWNDLRISPVRDAAGTVTHFVGIQSDITEIKNYQTELEYHANYDSLTGLANKNLFNDRLDRAISLAERTRGKLALLYLGLDRFKIVNDSLGHAAGDQLMKLVGARLKQAVLETDTVARLGGDEFAVILHELENTPSPTVAAQNILAAIEQPASIHGQEVFTSASIGVAIFPDDGATSDALLKNADTAMYRAKHAGRNQTCFYTEDLNVDALARLQLDADLRRALSQQEFELHYQPRVDLATGHITSVEALIRWRRADRGLVPPGHFIPVAEETGLIVPIGEWVLRTACSQMHLWRDAGLGDLRVAVNLSPWQFRQPDLVARVQSILTDTGLQSRNLELEITESVAMHDPESTRAVLEKLHGLGIALAIDDFGTGYSSLAYLKRFPIDYLKIDQSFVSGLPEDDDDRNIVLAIIALGRSLGLTLIAESVETEAQRHFLRAHGCHEMQGYLFCRPQPADQLAGVLGTRET